MLKLFLTDDLINHLVSYTNLYAQIMKETPEIQEKMDLQNRNIFKLWRPVTFDEMWTYIAVISLMGIINKPKYDMFWSKDSFISTPIFSRLMRRDRYTQIRKMIHFSDPEAEDIEDPLHKLSFFLNALQERFQQVYAPKQSIAVDEYLSLWKGRLKFRVYIPNKRERYGVKVYMLCESESAYLYSFIIYTGAGMTYKDPGIVFPKPFEEYPAYSRVVLSLLKGLYNQGYCVTLDNLYTEPYLLLALYENKTDSFGTLRKKKGLPRDFWLWKPQKGIGIPPMIKYHDEKLMVMRWNDCYKTKKKKIVSMLSTRHVGELVGTGKVHYATKDEIIKPDAIRDYNKSMGGVDTLSRVIIPYSIQKRGIKWYRKIGELFFDISMYNAFIVWRKLNPQRKESNLDFRMELIKTIIQYHLNKLPANHAGPGEPATNQVYNPLRLTERHFPSQKSQALGRRKSRCVLCHMNGIRREVIYECRQCDKALCIVPCFEMYHTRKNLKNQNATDSDSDEE